MAHVDHVGFFFVLNLKLSPTVPGVPSNLVQVMIAVLCCVIISHFGNQKGELRGHPWSMPFGKKPQTVEIRPPKEGILRFFSLDLHQVFVVHMKHHVFQALAYIRQFV